MPNSVHSILRASLWAAAAPLLVYTVFLGLGCIPVVQRNILYAHKINTLWLWADVNAPESWGFARNQVTPFGLETSDGESIYAWHIMPLPLYLQNEETVAKQELGFVNDFTKTESFRLLRSDPQSKLVISFHGNAGHIAQGFRPDFYHALTDTSSYHVVAIDYRGFGHSTGFPSEEGLIMDATAVVDWAMDAAGISSDRIVLLGQSLGTAVVSGVAEHFAIKGVEFAGVILVAGFSDLVTMLSGYRFAGLIPALGPFAVWPAFQKLLGRALVDQWNSAERVANIVRHTKNRLRLSFVHAKNDWDIPWTEDNKLFRSAASETVGILNDEDFEEWKETQTLRTSEDSFVTTWRTGKDIVVRQELFPYGGHNEILRSSPVILAVMRSFDLEGTTYN